MRALIATGAGRYGDPWHPYEQTSRQYAEVLEEVGFEVTTDDDVDRAMTALAGVDLLLVNAGDPWRGDDVHEPPPEPSLAGLQAALERGIGVMAFHAAVASLRDYPCWATVVGGVWLPGLSWHPPAELVRITLAPDLPLRNGLGDFDTFDERYLRLQPTARTTTVATFRHDAKEHPAVWLHEHDGVRAVTDLLGHDERSLESPGRRALVARLALWATGRSPGISSGPSTASSS